MSQRYRDGCAVIALVTEGQEPTSDSARTAKRDLVGPSTDPMINRDIASGLWVIQVSLAG